MAVAPEAEWLRQRSQAGEASRRSFLCRSHKGQDIGAPAPAMYPCAMKTPTRHQAYLPPIVPMDDAPRGMLDYAADPEGGAKIEKARQKLRDGKGVAVTPDYFEKMNRRVANRVAKARTGKA